MTATPSTMILRFRDLVTPPGQTLKNHLDIIEASKDSVWWGWWNKSGEKVPLDVMPELAKRADENGLDILLFDSGRGRLHRAVCSEIFWDRSGIRIESPNADLTPGYYRDQKYHLWFRLRSIDEEKAPEAALHDHTYHKVDSFFESGSSRFEKFYGKQVRSTEELQQQDRTIWFVRPYDPQDPAHEVQLLDARSISPEHFPRAFRQSESFRLLWLSDPHFSADHHAFPQKDTVSERSLAMALESACHQHGVEDFAGALVSGDVSWRASSAEFEMADQAYRLIMSWTNLRPYEFGICPGNHDIAFSDDPSGKGNPIQRALSDARKAFDEHYRRLFFIPPNEFICSGRRFLLGNALPVEIAFLNSSYLQQEQGHFQGHGFLGGRQLRHASEKMGWATQEAGPRPFRIAVLHHHVLPVTFRETPAPERAYSVVLDAEALVRWVIENRVDLVLHGHMHQPFHTRLERTASITSGGDPHAFHVVALGSSGVSLEHLGEIQKNTFGILDFSTGGCRIEVFSLHKTNPSEKVFEIQIPAEAPCRS